MKRLVFLLILVFPVMCIHSNAQSYYCERQGATLEYVRKYVKDGKFCWRHILNISEVNQQGNTRKIVSTSSFIKANGKPLYKGDVTEHVIVDEKDNVKTDMGQLTVSYIKARTGLNAQGASVNTVLPSDVEVGDTLPMIFAEAKVGPLSATVKLYDRKFIKKETISVPAGTFDCIVLEEKKIETGPGHNRTVRTLTWYTKGIGFVRHDTYIKEVLDTSEILYSLK